MAGALMTREPFALRSWFAREPLAVLDEMQDLVLTLFDARGNGRLIPSLDLSETETAIEVRMDVPGMKPNDIDIQLSGDTLTVRGERKEEKEEKGRTFHRVERTAGSFCRSIALPCAVKDEVDAQYRDGVLTVTLQKAEAARTRKIKIKS